ncbi:hypothetical protein BD414DRAFT_388367, partial [Trametes punicea]
MSPPTIARLNDENYTEWIVGMEALLTRKGLWEVTCNPVNDTRPLGSDGSRAVKNWQLRRVHQARGFGTRMALLRNFWRMAKRSDQPMTSWIADVRRAARTLDEIDAPIAEEHTILVLTNGLPDSYSQVIVSLDSTPADDLSLEYVIKRLINEESR